MTEYVFNVGDRVCLAFMPCCTGLVMDRRITSHQGPHAGLPDYAEYEIDWTDHDVRHDPLPWAQEGELRSVRDADEYEPIYGPVRDGDLVVDTNPPIYYRGDRRVIPSGDEERVTSADQSPDGDEHCCEDADELSSHYHCARCHERTSMMGHLNQDGTFSCE